MAPTLERVCRVVNQISRPKARVTTAQATTSEPCSLSHVWLEGRIRAGSEMVNVKNIRPALKSAPGGRKSQFVAGGGGVSEN